LSNHVIANVTVSMSERAYSRLPPADRDLIRQAVRDAGVHQKRVAIEAEAKVLDEFKAAGGTVINPDLDAFRAKAATIPDAFLSGKFKGLHQAVQQIQ
jgi:TRAP-type C4-dicarboxylate transport system substrate-binding protein